MTAASEARTLLSEQLAELASTASEVYENLMDAHQRHYLETMAYYNAGLHVTSVWRAVEYAKTALDQ